MAFFSTERSHGLTKQRRALLVEFAQHKHTAKTTWSAHQKNAQSRFSTKNPDGGKSNARENLA